MLFSCVCNKQLLHLVGVRSPWPWWSLATIWEQCVCVLWPLYHWQWKALAIQQLANRHHHTVQANIDYSALPFLGNHSILSHFLPCHVACGLHGVGLVVVVKSSAMCVHTCIQILVVLVALICTLACDRIFTL